MLTIKNCLCRAGTENISARHFQDKNQYMEGIVIDSVSDYLTAHKDKTLPIVSFDLDSTLVKTKSGATFPSSPDDWKWYCDKTAANLKATSTRDLIIVIFTNQAHGTVNNTKLVITQDGKLVETKLTKRTFNAYNAIVKLGVKCILFASNGRSPYRKPYIGMWEALKEYLIQYNIAINEEKCVYVGDAAGREKDFSCSDRLFAKNARIKFITQDRFYGDKTEQEWEYTDFDPSKYLKDNDYVYHICDNAIDCILANCRYRENIKKFDELIKIKNESNNTVVVITTSSPSSGKSTIAKYFEENGFKRVNRDTLKTQAKCVKAMKNFIKDGHSVIIDNTNPTKTGRANYITSAKETNQQVQCYGLFMNINKPLAMHLGVVRSAMNMHGDMERTLPPVAYHTFYKKVEMMEIDEGFESITEIDFAISIKSKQQFTYFNYYSSV